MRRVVLAALGLLIVLVGAVFAPQLLARISPPAAPRLATVSHRTFAAIVPATGSVVPKNQVQANFPISGTLTEVDVKVGDHVKAGQLLARINAPSQQGQLQLAQTQLQLAQTNLGTAQANYNDTVKRVNAQNAANQQQVAFDQQVIAADGCSTQTPAPTCSSDVARLQSDQARASSDQASGGQQISQAKTSITQAQSQVAVAQAGVNSAASGASLATLTASIDGIVLSVNGRVGENVSSGASNTTLAPGGPAPLPQSDTSSGAIAVPSSSAFIVLGDNSGYQVVAPFSETDAALLKSGQAATVTFDAIPNLSINGSVLAVAQGPTVVANVVNYYASISLANQDLRLKQGMTAIVSVPVAQASNVLAVPNQAVYTLDQKRYVDVWFHNQSVATQVSLGVIGDQLTEIKSGLHDGQQVVLGTHRNQTTNGSTRAPSLFGQ